MPKTLWLPGGERVLPEGGHLLDYVQKHLNSQWDRASCTANTYYNIGDDDVELTLSYTPDVHCRGIVGGRFLMYCAVEDVRYDTRIYMTAPSSEEYSHVCDYGGMNSASENFWRPHVHMPRTLEMVAGTTYTFEAQAAVWQGSGTYEYHCARYTYQTELFLYVFSEYDYGEVI